MSDAPLVLITSPDPHQEESADTIIRKHVTFAMAGGLIPVPLLDLAAVTAVQLDMLKQLAQEYGAPFDSGSARSFVTSLTSTLAGSVLARVGASMVKAIPGIGTVLGGITQVVTTGASTYAVGNLFRRVFREKRPIESLNVETVKAEAAAYYEKGVELAKSLARKV